MAQLKKDHERHVNRVTKSYEEKVGNLKFEIKRLNDVFDTFKEYTSHEYRLKDVILEKLENQALVFKENARRMRAVLRVPRLTKLYHDMIREEKM